MLIIHGTKDKIVPLKDGRKISKLIKSEHLYEFFTIPDGDHNDLFKNHKYKVFKKLREFLHNITKICFTEFSSEVQINSDFFKKLSPHVGDAEMEEHQNEIIEIENLENVRIKDYIDSPVNKAKPSEEKINDSKINIEDKNNDLNRVKEEEDVKIEFTTIPVENKIE